MEPGDGAGVQPATITATMTTAGRPAMEPGDGAGVQRFVNWPVVTVGVLSENPGG